MAEGDQKAKAERQATAPAGSWASDFPRVATVVVIVAVFVALMALLWYSVHVLLLVFGGILFAIFLRSLADGVSYLTGIGPTAALTAVILGLLALFVAAGIFLTPYIASQVDELQQLIPEAIEQVRQRMSQYQWGQSLLDRIPSWDDVAGASMGVWLGAFSALGWVTSVLTGVAVVFFLSIYLASDPKLYVNGVVHLVPMSYRPQLRELMQRLGHTLRWWLIGQGASMAFLAIVATTGLYLLGVPLAPVLGLLSGILAFMPTFGPILGSLLPILLAFAISPTLALYVIVFYLVMENFESYLLTPMIQQRVVQLPKALAITFQIMLLILVGPLGLLFGHPLAAVTMVTVQQLYVRDTLGDRSSDIPGD
ncbi:MAG: AI-2E family transporter [Phycisphaeraceae bacterium]